MLTQWLKAQLARHPVSGPAVLAQWLRRRAHEDDFRLFEAVSELPGLVLDIGAHRGQSAVSILRRTRRLRVLSFEPNRSLVPTLLMLRVLHPFRFRFRSIAVGRAQGEATLFIPGRTGSILSPQAALDLAEYRKAPAMERLAAAGIDAADPGSFRRRRVAVTVIDGEALRPDVVKIDAEGSENAILQGMRQTLERCRPALLVEVNDTHAWVPWLQQMGYQFYRYDPAADALLELGNPEAVLNLVGLHPHSPSPVAQSLMARVRH